MLKVLVCCEESQRVMTAFRNLGADSYSCDIKPCSGGFPQYHFQSDVFSVLDSDNWDLIICHPPCTYLTSAGSWLLSDERFVLGSEAASFFFRLYNYHCDYICIENPTPLHIYGLPLTSRQVIHPYMFGEPYYKRTCLWVKNLPFLKPTCIVRPIKGSYVQSSYKGLGCSSRSEFRSKTFKGIADAMASQWIECLDFPKQVYFNLG